MRVLWDISWYGFSHTLPLWHTKRDVQVHLIGWVFLKSSSHLETDSSYSSTWNHPASVPFLKFCSIRTWMQDSTMMHLFRGIWVHLQDTHTHSTRFNTHASSRNYPGTAIWIAVLCTDFRDIKRWGGKTYALEFIPPLTASMWADNEIQSNTRLTQHHTEALRGRDNHFHFICTTVHL